MDNTNTNAGYIYILTNPATPDLVKIGYADDVPERMRTLFTSGVVYPFHCYATFETKNRLEDITVHHLIDTINPALRENSNREFYRMSKERAFEILKCITMFNGSISNPVLNPYDDECTTTRKTVKCRTYSENKTTSPKAFILNGEVYNVNSWADAYRTMVDYVMDNFGYEFLRDNTTVKTSETSMVEENGRNRYTYVKDGKYIHTDLTANGIMNKISNMAKATESSYEFILNDGEE